MQKITPLFIILLSLFIINACSSAYVKPSTLIETKSKRLEKQSLFEAQKNNYPAATKTGHEALRLYSLLDDRLGQLRSHINLTRLYLLQNQQSNALQHLQLALQLIIETKDQSFQYSVALLAGKISNHPGDFKKALAAASTAIEQAIAETYLKNYPLAYNLIKLEQPKTVSEIDDFAFVLLQYSQHASYAEAAKKSLALFKKNENAMGISASLYILGKIAKKQGNSSAAKQYFNRALKVNIAIDDSQRIADIKQQLSAP